MTSDRGIDFRDEERKMEAESRLIVGAMAVATVTLAEFMTRRIHTRRCKEILKALEGFEAHADKGIDDDIKGVAHKWTLLRLASKDPQKYKVTEHKDRIDAQLKALEPHTDNLAHQMSIGAGLNLGAIVEKET